MSDSWRLHSPAMDCSPPGSSVHGILQARMLEWAAISFSNAWKWKVKVKSLSRVWLFATPWTAAHQAPLSMGVSRQEYWSGLPFPPPGQKSFLIFYLWLYSKNLVYKPLPLCLVNTDIFRFLILSSLLFSFYIISSDHLIYSNDLNITQVRSRFCGVWRLYNSGVSISLFSLHI